jgi:hypothetical protein
LFVHVTAVPAAILIGFGMKPAVPELLLAPTGIDTAVALGVGVGVGVGVGEVYIGLEELPHAAERMTTLHKRILRNSIVFPLAGASQIGSNGHTESQFRNCERTANEMLARLTKLVERSTRYESGRSREVS